MGKHEGNLGNQSEQRMGRGQMHEGLRTFVDIQRALGTTLVGTNQAGIVYAVPGERKAIATHDLTGCTTLVVEFEKTQKPPIKKPPIKGAVVAHFSPNAIKLNYHEPRVVPLLDEISSQGTEAHATIASPGVPDMGSPTGYRPAASETNRIEIMTTLVKSRLGEDTPVVSVGYSSAPAKDNIEQGTVLVEYPSESGQQRKLRVGGVSVPVDTQDSSGLK